MLQGGSLFRGRLLAAELATLKDEDFDLELLGLTTPISTACSQELSRRERT
jgi:hypothetical protein